VLCHVLYVHQINLCWNMGVGLYGTCFHFHLAKFQMVIKLVTLPFALIAIFQKYRKFKMNALKDLCMNAWCYLLKSMIKFYFFKCFLFNQKSGICLNFYLIFLVKIQLNFLFGRISAKCFMSQKWFFKN
jgi:hypothetical protein